MQTFIPRSASQAVVWMSEFSIENFITSLNVIKVVSIARVIGEQKICRMLRFEFRTVLTCSHCLIPSNVSLGSQIWARFSKSPTLECACEVAISFFSVSLIVRGTCLSMSHEMEYHGTVGTPFSWKTCASFEFIC